MTNPEEHKACCGFTAAFPANCPACGKPGRKVAGLTLDHQLAPIYRSRLGEMAGFCANPDCEVVYFNASATVNKGETLQPVWQKDMGDNVYVCYCFGIKRADIRRDLAATGTTGIPGRIRQGITKGNCECEKKNPQGACCLGNVAEEIRKIKEEVKSHEKKQKNG